MGRFGHTSGSPQVTVHQNRLENPWSGSADGRTGVAATPEDDIDESWQASLAQQFAELTRAMTTGGQLDPAGLITFVAKVVGPEASAGLTLLSARGAPRTLAATDQLPHDVDALQYSLREGPCLEAIDADDLAVTGELAHDDRWPSFGPRCAKEFGVHSMLGVRLVLDGPERGALNIYAPARDAFTDADVDLAATLSPFVSLVLQNVLHERRIEDLETALSSSRSIGTAVGILMGRYLLSAEDAFAQLSRASQELNRKVRDLAVHVQLTGELPPSPTRDPVTDEGV